MDRRNLWPGDQDRQLFDLTRHVGENTASLRSLEKSVERVQGQLDGVEQVVAGLPGEMSGKLAEAIRAEVAPLRDDLEELSRQAAYLTTRFNDADTAARERWRLAKVLFFVLSGIWTFLGWFMTKFGPVIFSSLGFGNPGGRTMSAARRYDWETIRAEYEAGASQSDLARRYGLSRTAIQKRIKAEGWMQDVSHTIDRLTEAKVAGVVAGCNPKKKAEALDAAAERKAAVIMRHKAEWDRHKAIMDEALTNEDFNAAKLAKITAETLKIRQDGERRAWGIQDKSETGPSVPVRAEVRLDLSGQPPQAVAELARAAFREEMNARKEETA